MAPKFGWFNVKVTGGKQRREEGVVGQHWAVRVPHFAMATVSLRTEATDIDCGGKTDAFDVTPIDAVGLVMELDALGPYRTEAEDKTYSARLKAVLSQQRAASASKPEKA